MANQKLKIVGYSTVHDSTFGTGNQPISADESRRKIKQNRIKYYLKQGYDTVNVNIGGRNESLSGVYKKDYLTGRKGKKGQHPAIKAKHVGVKVKI